MMILLICYTFFIFFNFIFFNVRPPLELLPVLGPLEQYVMPTLDPALLSSSRAVLIWVLCRT